MASVVAAAWYGWCTEALLGISRVPALANFFFGRTFDLVSGEKCFCACAV